MPSFQSLKTTQHAYFLVSFNWLQTLFLYQRTQFGYDMNVIFVVIKYCFCCFQISINESAEQLFVSSYPFFVFSNSLFRIASNTFVCCFQRFSALLLTRFCIASNNFPCCCKRLLALLRTCVYVGCNTFLALSEYIFGFPQTLFCCFLNTPFAFFRPFVVSLRTH